MPEKKAARQNSTAITVLHRNEEYTQLLNALQASEQRFRATFEQAAVGIAHVSLDGHWLLVNERLCRIIGYTHEELLQITFQDITHPDDLDADISYVKHLLAGDIETYTMEKRYIRKDHSQLWVDLTVSLVRDKDMKPDYFISVIEDITERKKVEEFAQQACQELASHAEQLEQMNQMLNDFVTMVSHEFRTTLTSIQGFSEIMRDQITDFSLNELQDFSNDIHIDATRLRRMIDDLLDLERMKAGKMVLHNDCVDLNALCADIIERTQMTASTHTIRLQIDDEQLFVVGDSDKLTQVFMNLLSNAIKYSEKGTTITMNTSCEEDMIHIRVQDQGIGIPKEALEKIFVPYNRVEAGKTRYIRGTGLGLSIVRQIMQMHNGRVWVESTKGQGSTFHVAFPCIPCTLEKKTAC